MQPTLLFDIDGVLGDFQRAALAIHKKWIPYEKIEWDFWKQVDLKAEEFYAPLDYAFWRDIEPLADGMELLRLVEKLVPPEQIGLLTAPILNDGCCDGKRAWVKKHLPEYFPRLIIGGAKHMLAGPSKILIDDSLDNCEKFRLAGGRFYLVPRPWNPFKLPTFDPQEAADSIARKIESMKPEFGE